MKKTYIKPQMKVMKIATEQLFATSPGFDMYSGEGNQIGGDQALGREDDYDGGISTPNLWEQGW